MPAVQVEDLSVLPRIAPVDPEEANERHVVQVVDAPRTLEGAGFEVRRAFASIDPRLADPFILLDHMAQSSMPRERPRERPTIPIGASRLLPT